MAGDNEKHFYKLSRIPKFLIELGLFQMVLALECIILHSNEIAVMRENEIEAKSIRKRFVMRWQIKVTDLLVHFRSIQNSLKFQFRCTKISVWHVITNFNLFRPKISVDNLVLSWNFSFLNNSSHGKSLSNSFCTQNFVPSV